MARRLLAHSKPHPQQQGLRQLLFREAGRRAILQRYGFLQSLNVVRANSLRGAEWLSVDHTPTAVGVLNYPNQVEKRSTASTDSPIYSTINTAAAEDDLLAYYDTYSSATYTQGPDPYSSNPILANSGLVGLEQDLDHWTIQSGQSGSEYAKLQYNKKSKGKEDQM